MIKLFGNPMSTCTRKVLATLHETNTPFELDAVDFGKGENKQPTHMARQPFGQVPAIDDDGFAMYESRAIARYIDAKAGGKLTPTDLKHRAKMDQWMSVEVEDFTPHAMKFVYEHIFKRPQPAEVMTNATQRLELACSVLDKNLTGKTFMVGDQFTLADITYAPYIEYAINTPAKDIFAKHPNFMAWWGRVRERPSWMKAAGRAA
jgi:glutathione S-transferase